MSSNQDIDDFFNSKDLNETLGLLEILEDCNICPRKCGVNRFLSQSGYCGGNDSFNIASICRHMGEEPVISGSHGICNIFFGSCNLQCVFCQNYQISSNTFNGSKHTDNLKKIIQSIIYLLDEGCHAVGFVSPSHNIPHVKVIVNILRKLGRNPVFVLNTNAYDEPDVLLQLENIIDIYLPDFKYMDNLLGQDLSDANDYPEIAGKAIKEMCRQKGGLLKINDKGEAETGMIIRHLVLPGYIENSLAVLRFIAEEISPDVNISLMSQYNPIKNVKSHPNLKRRLSSKEYDIVVDEMHKLGIKNGWIQELDSPDNYNPDFNKEEPFK